MNRALFTIICALFLASTSSAIAQTPAPQVPAAKAVGTGPWADGLTHVVQGSNIGRGCLKVKNFQVAAGKALYSCLTLEDQRFHVIYDTDMDKVGYSKIENLKLGHDGKPQYTGYEGLKRCQVVSNGETTCWDNNMGVSDIRYPLPPRVSMGSSAIDTSPPALPLSMTGGKTVTSYWVVNNQPLWIDCDDTDGCRMRWNGHSQGKAYHSIDTVLVEGNQVAYSVQLAKDGEYKVVWGSSEGESFQKLWGFNMLNNQPIYAGSAANSLNYFVKGRQKEAFRSIDHLEVKEGKVFMVARKDFAVAPSPI